MALTYEKGRNRPVRLQAPTMDPTGGNLAGTCGGTNIGASTGVIGSGLMGEDTTSSGSAGAVAARQLTTTSVIGDAVFPAAVWAVFNINNISDGYSGLSYCFFSQAVTDVVNGGSYPSVVGYLPTPKNAAFTTAYAGDKGYAPVLL